MHLRGNQMILQVMHYLRVLRKAIEAFFSFQGHVGPTTDAPSTGQYEKTVVVLFRHRRHRSWKRCKVNSPVFYFLFPLVGVRWTPIRSGCAPIGCHKAHRRHHWRFGRQSLVDISEVEEHDLLPPSSYLKLCLHYDLAAVVELLRAHIPGNTRYHLPLSEDAVPPVALLIVGYMTSERLDDTTEKSARIWPAGMMSEVEKTWPWAPGSWSSRRKCTCTVFLESYANQINFATFPLPNGQKRSRL